MAFCGSRIGLVLVSALCVALSPLSARAVELELFSARKDFVKSSMKAIGKGIEHGDLVSILRSSKTKSDLLVLKKLFYSRFSPKPIAVKCRYGAAPQKKRALNLNHSLEVRVDVPLDVPLKDAAVSVSVDRSHDAHESASVFLSFSF